MEALASASSSGVSGGRPFARPRRWYWMASAGKPCSMWQPTLWAPGSLRSDSLRLLSPSDFKGAEPDLRSAILRSCRWPGGIDPRPGGVTGGGRPGLFQPAVVGVGAGDVAAGDVGPAGAACAGLVCASVVVVTGPAELPFSQADQDSCQ
jgi:hypothetical protein